MSKAEGSACSTLAMISGVNPLARSVPWLMPGAFASCHGRPHRPRHRRSRWRDSRGPQRFRHRTVDDLEIPAARELLEFHQREVRFDAGGIAIHHQADRAGRRDDARLRVAEAVLGAEGERTVPGAQGMLGKPRETCGNGAGGVIEPHRRRRELLIAGRLAVGGAAMVADHAQHVLAILAVTLEGAELGSHFGRGGVGDPGHDRAQRPANGAAAVGIIGDAARHQEAAEIGKAETQGAKFVGEPRDLAGGELGHQDRDFEYDGPQPHGMLVAGEVEFFRRRSRLRCRSHQVAIERQARCVGIRF